MRNRSSETQEKSTPWLPIILITLAASNLPFILLREGTGAVPTTLPYIKLAVLLAAAIISSISRQSGIARYSMVLGVIVLTEVQTQLIFTSSFWQSTVDKSTFLGNFGGSIFLKLVATIPVLLALRGLYSSFPAVYLTGGDLSVKAQPIPWLGIHREQITWGKLAIISALCISLGTLLLTLLTVIGAPTVFNTGSLFRYFPFILLLAMLNSFSEGVQFRSAILGSLREVLPKNLQILTAAIYFGIGHYYGAPSGVVGVIMSGLLGWFMCRSMVETKGFVSSWIIHFMQDVVIFSTIALLGGFY
jgi:hypothetical protein